MSEWVVGLLAFTVWVVVAFLGLAVAYWWGKGEIDEDLGPQIALWPIVLPFALVAGGAFGVYWAARRMGLWMRSLERRVNGGSDD